MHNYSFNLNIVTPIEQIYSGSVVQVTVRGSEGDIGVHYGHAPLLTSVLPSMLTLVKKGGEAEYLYVAGGMMEIQPKGVNIMADTVIRAEHIDKQSAERAKKRAEENLKHCKNDEYLKLELELVQALAQLRVLKTSHRMRAK